MTRMCRRGPADLGPTEASLPAGGIQHDSSRGRHRRAPRTSSPSGSSTQTGSSSHTRRGASLVATSAVLWIVVRIHEGSFANSAFGFTEAIDSLNAHGAALAGMEGPARWGTHVAIALAAAGFNA